ncbi:MAG: hypothetical protein ABJA10_00205 [Aestuariivirga sp.]
MLAPAITAALAAIGLGAIWLKWRGKLIAAAAICWALYAAYEFMMYKRIWCSGECNIRVDLLLFYPILGAMAIAALVSFLMRRGKT